MKRILVYGMTANPGGIESYLVNLAKNINPSAFALDFVSDFPTIAYRKELESVGAHIYTIPPKGKHLFQHLITFFKLLRNHPEYSICYFNLLDAGGAITAFIPWIMGRKVVVHSHNSNTEKVLLHKCFRPILQFMTSRYVTCSDAAALYMFGEKITKKNIVLKIPNAIKAADYVYSPSKRASMRSSLGLTNQLTICHVGRITTQKNPYGLIHIFNEIHNRHSDSILLYIGTGELELEIKQYVSQNNLSNSVFFLGTRKDVPDLLQAADIFLLPSYYEGLSIALIEAQAAGLPCFVSEATFTEADCTGLITYLSTTDAPELWATAILASNCSRQNTLTKLKASGFDTTSSLLYISRLEELFGGL